MNSVSLVTANTPITTTAVANAVPIGADSATVTLASSPASVVMLGQDVKVPDAITYSNRGVVTNGEPVYSLEVDVHDALSLALTGNMSTSSTAGRFQGLGAALLKHLTDGDSASFSQSIIRSQAGNVPDAAALKSAQTQLHGDKENTITLTLKTTSGATISLNLASNGDGLAVSADVSGGKLSDVERQALASLADSFQGAIDGLTAKTPRLNLGDLAQLDPSVFTSVDISASVKLGQDKYQTLSFKANETTKSIDMSGITGNVQLSVKNNSALLGNAQQQAAAVKSYLEQFDAAQNRGEGDKDLMALFKDAFSALQASNKNQSSPAASPVNLNAVEHSMLTGLADFSASVVQTAQYINPMRPTEADTFAYKASQNTETKGTDPANRSLEQKQNSSLNASFHKSLFPGVGLALTAEADSQNYQFHMIKDQASSTSRIGYTDGALVEASTTQTAHQQTDILKYQMGKLVDTVSTPKEVAKSQNLMNIINDALSHDRTSRLTTGKSTLEDDLVSVHDKVLLQSDPAYLAR